MTSGIRRNAKAEEDRKAKEAEQQRSMRTTITRGVAVRGSEYRTIRQLSSLDACTSECNRDPQCKMFAYWNNNNICYLFDSHLSTYPAPSSTVGQRASN